MDVETAGPSGPAVFHGGRPTHVTPGIASARAGPLVILRRRGGAVPSLSQERDATAALAASLFHYGELRIEEVKEYLHHKGIPVRE